MQMFLFNVILLFGILFSASLSSHEILNKMTVEEKVGQLLMVHFIGEEANEEASHLIKKIHVGAFIYYTWANGLNSPKQVANLSSGLQQLAQQTPNKIPLIIAVDQEGGRICRLKEGFTPLPDNRTIAFTGIPAIAEKYAYTTALELRAVGINMNLAPVVDINSNPENLLMTSRSYGSDAESVVAYAKCTLDGFYNGGLLSCLKHYPGHGNVNVDSHLGLPVVNKSKDELMDVELVPFKALASVSDAIMTGHILVPSVDGSCCASTSKVLISILREDIGFSGPIITDSLVMQGVLEKYKTPEDAALAAFEAGCDILMLGGKLLSGNHAGYELTAPDIVRVHQYIVNAVQSGRISEERLDQSVLRILNIKQKL